MDFLIFLEVSTIKIRISSLYIFFFEMGILYSFIICLTNYLLAVKVVYPRLISRNLFKHILVFFVIRIIVILFITYLILTFTSVSDKVYLLSLFFFYFVFKLIEVFKINKIELK